MKKFRFKFSPFILALIILVSILALAGLGWNIFNVITYIGMDLLKGILYCVALLLNLLLCIVAISMFFSCYTFNNEYLVSNFGIIPSKTKLADIVGITHFKKSDKLVLYYKDEKFSVVLISPQDYNEFIKVLIHKNTSISYSLDD